MNQGRLNTILSTFPNRTILVVGDFFLDKYLVLTDSVVKPPDNREHRW
jgi:bifunctional ADP-heptose synthase (sugar kinase/adenylyltransferase)